MSLHVHTSTKLSVGLLFSFLFTFLLTGPFAMREIEKTDQNEFFSWRHCPYLKFFVGVRALSAQVLPPDTHIHLTGNFPSIANGSE